MKARSCGQRGYKDGIVKAQLVCVIGIMRMFANVPKRPRHCPTKLRQIMRHIINTARAARAATHHAKKRQPDATQKAITGKGFIAIFRTSWQMPARIADKA